MHVYADVPLLGDCRFTCVQTHANPDGSDSEGITTFGRSGERI
jgi:hypothetical protein